MQGGKKCDQQTLGPLTGGWEGGIGSQTEEKGGGKKKGKKKRGGRPLRKLDPGGGVKKTSERGSGGR